LRNHVEGIEHLPILRRRAEDILRERIARFPTSATSLSAGQGSGALHEMSIDKIEEMQNEELRRALVQMEATRIRYTDLYDQAPVGYVTVSERGLILHANLTAAELLCASRNELINQPMTRFISREDQDLFSQRFQQLIVAGDLHAYDLRMKNTKGVASWVHLTAKTAKDCSGVKVFHLVLTDITERKEAEVALQQSEEKYRSLFEHMAEGVVLHELVEDENGSILDYRIIDLNPSFQKHTGIETASAHGHLGTEVYKMAPPPYLEEYSRVATTGRSYTFETFFLPLKKCFRISVFSPARGQFATVFEDVTDQKRKEKELLDISQRLSLATASANLGVWDWDIQAGTMIWNDRMLELYGTSREEVKGTIEDWKSGLHPDNFQSVLAECEAALRGDAPFNTEFRVKHQDGTVRWIVANAQVLRDEQGNPVRMIGINRDITEHKQDEAALLASEEKFFKSFRSAPFMCALSTLDDGQLIEANDLYCHILEFTREELIGKTTIDLGIVRQEDRDKIKILIEHKDNIKNIEYNLYTKNGKQIPCLFSGETFYVDGQKILISMLADITELKQAERERQLLENQLHQAQKMESLGILVSGVAHNINNVLGIIMGMASLREQRVNEPADQEAYQRIGKVCLRGREVVKSLIHFAQSTHTDQAPFDLNALVHEVYALLESTTRNHIKIVETFAEESLWINGNAGDISHILVNLGINSLDAMPDGGILTFRTSAQKENRVEVSVEDNGTGMTPEVLIHVMEPFYTTKEVGKGTGLGLSMTYGIVKAHGGTIDITSQPGQGTTVKLRFPRIPILTQAKSIQVPMAYLGSMKVFLVDDDEDVRFLMMRMLKQAGVRQVKSFPGGEEVLERLRSGELPDLIILDQNMPGMNGTQTMARIRDFVGPAMPILISSGQPDIEAWGIFKQPSVAVISKPFTMDEIQAKLAEFVLEQIPVADPISQVS